jgi:hypothetical protein
MSTCPVLIPSQGILGDPKDGMGYRWVGRNEDRISEDGMGQGWDVGTRMGYQRTG